MTSWDELTQQRVMAHMDAADSRRMQLENDYGKPEMLSNADALAAAKAAGVMMEWTPSLEDLFVSFIYRDEKALEGWLASNRENHGHTGLFRVPLPDGRVIGAMLLNQDCHL